MDKKTPKEIAELEINSDKNYTLAEHQRKLAGSMRTVADYENPNKKTDWMTETDYEVAKAKVGVLKKFVEKMENKPSVSIGNTNGVSVG